MPSPTTEPTTQLEKMDRCGDLPHRPRVLLGKMGLDGHDRGVKLIARALRDSGVHVIYSGLWQTPRSLAISARDEDADCIACSMMSNSHLILVPKLIEECGNVGRPDMIVDVGGIIPQSDIQAMHDAGVRKVFNTGTSLEAIVETVRDSVKPYDGLTTDHATARLAREISFAHAGEARSTAPRRRPNRVVGITGSPGAGKSTLVAQMASEFVRRGGRMAVIAFDPQSPITSGALLGDRLRVDFNSLDEGVFYRSLAIEGEDYSTLPDLIELIGGAGFDQLIIETVGAGQNDVAIRDITQDVLLLMMPGAGDAIQFAKAGVIEIATSVVLNKADLPGADATVREIKDALDGGRPVWPVSSLRGEGFEPLCEWVESKLG
jgi:methylmalonyl-CoA mutase cobalamin-binding domain/chain